MKVNTKSNNDQVVKIGPFKDNQDFRMVLEQFLANNNDLTKIEDDRLVEGETTLSLKFEKIHNLKQFVNDFTNLQLKICNYLLPGYRIEYNENLVNYLKRQNQRKPLANPIGMMPAP